MRDKKDLDDVASILRRDSLKMTSHAGSGHPTSCMSCAEIMSVLFFNEMSFNVLDALDPDNDEFVLSKGHAAPILYSCLNRAGCIHEDLMTLRSLNSNLEGHPMPRSIDWVKVATGSLGQGLSVGVGMAMAAKFQKRNFRTYVLMGDSEIAEGSVYEAMQLASHYKLDNLVSIVDVNRLGQRGETMLGHDVRTYARRFESFGWKAIIIDGHKTKQVMKAFRKARKAERPVVIIAKTLKGKGVSILEDKEGWHGIALKEDELEKALREIPGVNMPTFDFKKPERLEVGMSSNRKMQFSKYKIGDEVATRDAYGKAIAGLAKALGNFVAIDGEVSNSTKSAEVKKENPGKFIEAYIAEQNMIGVALGMAVKGMDVFASSFAAFLSRAHDQIRMAALSNADFTISGSHAGVSIGEDGASQMALEDFGIFRALPESYVFYPSDAVSTEKIVELCSRLKGIKYIRTTRPKGKVLYSNSEAFKPGDFKVLKKSGKDKAVIVGAGVTLNESLKAHDMLEKKGKRTAVVDLYCIKPFDSKKFVKFVKQHGSKVIVAEDHYLEGGIGEMLSGVLAGEKIILRRLAVNEIPHSGKKDELLAKYKINANSIVKEVLNAKKKR